MTPTIRTATEIASSLTERSLELFRLYADDAGNWSGYPLVGGNVSGSKSDRGNLTHLKKAGLLSTWQDDGTWIQFSEDGKRFAQEHFGIEI